MEEFNYFDEDTMDCYDSHEYCEYQQSTSVPVNFRTYTQRSFLNACIKLIYLMSDWTPPTSVENDKNLIRNILDAVVAQQKSHPFFAANEKVKKRLFLGTRQLARKMAKPKRKQFLAIECKHFKPQRHILGVSKLRRNLISQELKGIQMEWRHRERTLPNQRLLEASARSMLYMEFILGTVPYAYFHC